MPIVIDDFSLETAAPAQTGPDNIWAADLDDCEPTDADRARWAEQAAPDAEVDMLQRAASLERGPDGNIRFASPFIDMF